MQNQDNNRPTIYSQKLNSACVQWVSLSACENTPFVHQQSDARQLVPLVWLSPPTQSEIVVLPLCCTNIFEVPIEHTWCFRLFYSIRVITSVASLVMVVNSQLCDWHKLLVHIIFWSIVIRLKPLSQSYRALCTHAHRVMRNKFQTCRPAAMKQYLQFELPCDFS